MYRVSGLTDTDWVELYPRLSIDDSARVRELSHQLLFHLLSAAKKRMAKRLPSFVGAWLAGTFDRDKRVARAASDALTSFLQTKEKEAAFWKAVQTRALQFAIEAINETPDTLSDERSTTKQDSEAKYHRVVGASLSLALNLVRKGDIEALQDDLGRYLDADAIWTTPKAEDAFVRRAFYQLLHALIDTKPKLLEPRLQQAGKALVADGLRTTQTGSATDLLRVLASMTARFPQVWGTQKHPLQRLQQFVSKGSQGGAEEYWHALDQLLLSLRERTPSVEVISAFLASLRQGIAERLESRTGRNQAFQSYAWVLELFLGDVPLGASFLEDNLSGLTSQYLHPTPGSPLPTPQRPDSLAEAWIIVGRHPNDETRKAVAEEWQKLASAFLSRMSNSLPEVSEGYQKSQTSIASEGERWFAFAASVLSREHDKNGSLPDVIAASSRDVLDGALSLLTRRNFKPFGAASVIQSAFRHLPVVCSDNNLLASLFPVERIDTYRFIAASPSLPYLVSDLHTISDGTGRFGEIWTSLTEAALQLSDPPSVVSSVRVLVAIPSVATYAQKLPALQSFLVSAWKQYANGGTLAALKDLCEASLTFDILTGETTSVIAAEIVSCFDSQETSHPAVAALEVILQKKPELLHANSDLHVQLVTKLLSLTELADQDLAEKARSLKSLLDKQPTEQSHVARILETHLCEAGPSSLGIDTVVQQALTALNSGAVPAEDIFPSSTVWMNELSSFLATPPSPTLSLTSSMGGTYFLVQGDRSLRKPSAGRDSSGRSIPARMALFTANLLSLGVQLSSLPPEFQLELVYLLCLTEALTSDHLSTAQTDGLWTNGFENESEAQEFCELSSAAVSGVVASCGSWVSWDMSGDSLVERLINFMLREAVGSSPRAFYTSKALSSLFQYLLKVHGGPPTALEAWLARLGVMRVAPNTTLVTAAFLTGFGEALASSNAVSTLCARLISEIPGFADFSNPRTLPTLVLLNLCMDVYEAEELGYKLAAETCKAVARVLPAAQDTYGPYWDQAAEYCIWLWKRAANDRHEERLPYIFASLKLMQAFHAAEDLNDDLVDALKTHREAESAALIALLGIPREATGDMPSQVVDALLARAVSRIPNVRLEDLADIYESVASESREIQKAAFGLLHKALPAAQEDINLAVVMDKKAASLPNELLSLLLNAPNPDDYSDEELARFPVAIRSYLLAWHLVFDAYSTASFRVRNDYTDNLRSGKHLDPLLHFMVDVLGHGLARALDLDKEGFTAEHIRSYSIDLADSEPAERDMNWLLIHLFYLILKYIPGLFKMWYLDCPSKQTKNTIQLWMQKFFSPLIISDALDEVVEWASNQETGDPDTQEIVVKVSKAMHEITAGYPVDDDAATISLHVPKSYPLDPVDVVSVKRVAVKEDKWQAWLKATKAVIMFGNCSLVDGLMAFRRNILLAMKGQEECAICYSIIAPDKTLPDKKCGTCNHYFHRVCLYKWFQNSGRNTCPLCRNAIDYLGADTKRRRPEHE
ncbi:41b5d8ae-620d-42e7-ace4-c6f3d0796fa2 [Thermothielavioides terrestris]|uniref:E3 ubiquitin-protein ligase listerin n=1 Tax=Thermothielavioides terrestris TaxID=2587410 RepID=A0A3S4AT88_9PEZI|nr:41b5d8ae-620d-42e7-ace4-c6f3d0796fa2 [Thermothielavioides terrestris]